MFRVAAAFAILACATSPVAADVVDSSPAGFTLSKTVSIAAAPDTVWDTLRMPQRWWSKDHTWSSDAANLSIDERTGCFCERLPGRGKVEHARLVFVDKGRLLRMTGAFGPLQAMAVSGVMTFELTPDGGKATRVKMTYTIGGYMAGGLDKIAPMVDAVLGEQLDGLKTAAEASRPK